MAKINENFLNLQGSYLFQEIAKRVANYTTKNPNKKVISLGIGDVTLPLSKVVVKALKTASEEMGVKETFHGYGPATGYGFLKQRILSNVFKKRGISLLENEIFITTGAKSDTANIAEIFSQDAKVAVLDPVYPVYVEANVMMGRSGAFKDGRFENLVYLECNKENNFSPDLPKEKVDLIYLCYPNNPTGTVLTKEELQSWVNYARENKAIILYDAAYEAFITDKKIPHSIYEIDGAKEVAIEFHSFSKDLGFTGTRCAYTIIPNELTFEDTKHNVYKVKDIWEQRMGRKFNGVSYILQKAAFAGLSPEGQKYTQDNIHYYLNNAQKLNFLLKKKGIESFGGVNSPYLWVKTKEGLDSWAFFDYLLENFQIVGTPGSGFGKSGEGYFRFSALGDASSMNLAIQRLETL